MPLQFGIEYKVHNKAAYPLHSGLPEWMKVNSVGLIYIHTIEFVRAGYIDFYITKEKSDSGINRSMRIVFVKGYEHDVSNGEPMSMLKSFDDPQKCIIMETFMEIVRDSKN